MLITREDIQRVGDEETLLHFLEEKLNLPIPEGATLAQIALRLPPSFFGLDESISEQIIDCRDFSGFPEDDLGSGDLFSFDFGMNRTTRRFYVRSRKVYRKKTSIRLKSLLSVRIGTFDLLPSLISIMLNPGIGMQRC